MGSCAGAGSGEFHVYRASRRRELTRLENIEVAEKEEEEMRLFTAKVERNKLEAMERTRKNAEKRKKKKENQRKKNRDDIQKDESEDDSQPESKIARIG